MKKILLAGNPNSGKSTVFNALTGLRQKVGNWPGVTVEKLMGEFEYQDDIYEVTDLPGIYSLSAFSEDEIVARHALLNPLNTQQNYPDLIINVIDSCNLERNLFLTLQLQELGIPMVVVLNMMDLATQNGIELVPELLAQRLKLPVIPMAAQRKKGLDTLRTAIVQTIEARQTPPTITQFPPALQDELEMLQAALPKHAHLALRILENDPQSVLEARLQGLNIERLQEAQQRIQQEWKHESDVLIAQYRYEGIEKLTHGAIRRPQEIRTLTDRIDRFFLHRILGFPLFLGIMYLVFWFTINVGGAFIDFFDVAAGAIFVTGSQHLLEALHSPEFLTVMISNGIGAGIQTLATFIPILFALFLMIAILESSGYMARAAFVMDRLMRLIGLPGKAFIPLLVGFGCTVPAISASRTLERRRDRILTIFMSPFMSCGAKMPVYALFAAAFFPTQGQNIVFMLYIIGVLLAIATGLLLKHTVFRGAISPFVMELPAYHVPHLKDISLGASFRLKAFMKKASRVLIPVIAVLGILNSVGSDGSFGNEDSEKSVLTVIGRSITPVFEPLGIGKDNWAATVGIFTGLFAKEVIVGTLNSLYATSAQEPETQGTATQTPWQELTHSMLEALQTIPANIKDLGNALTDPMGIAVGEVENESSAAESMGVQTSIFQSMHSKFAGGTASAFAYLLFVLLYVPCLTAFSSAWKEMGAALAVMLLIYSTSLAWVVATLYYQISAGHSVFWIAFALVLFIVVVVGIVSYSNRQKHFEDSPPSTPFQDDPKDNNTAPVCDC